MRPEVISFVPGPAHVRREVLAAMATPPLPHRSEEFRALVGRVQRALGVLLETAAPVFPVLASATAALEIALRSVARSRVLVVVNGSFADRLTRIAASIGLEVEPLAVPGGDPVEPGLVERALAQGGFDTVAFVHCETSTGALSDLAAVADVVKARPGTALVVDAVSSLGGVPIAFDSLGPEVVLVAATGKALACPPGMAIVAASPGAVERARSSTRVGFATGLADMAEWHRRGETPSTPNTSLFHALDVQLPTVLGEGMPARATRHREMAALARGWAEERFAVFTRADAVSPTVTVIENTRAIDVPALLRETERRGFRIANGHGAWAGATFRIGHMGDVTFDDVRALLAVLDESLAAIA